MGNTEDIEYRQTHSTAADAHQKSPARFDVVWELAVDAMALSDEHGIVLAANPAYCELYGYTPEEIIGQSFAIIFPEELRAWAIEEYKRTFADPQIAPSVESPIQRKDGSTRIVEARYTFITQEGRRTAMLSIIRDHTERKRVEEERDRLLEQEQSARATAEQALMTRDQLLAVVSHDLKNPLTSILANTQIISRRISRFRSGTAPETAELEDLGDALSRIEATSMKMVVLLEQLTDFAAIQEGQLLRLQLRQIDLVSLAHDVVEEYRKVTRRHNFRFEPAETSLVGSWDANRLERIIDNLLSNAVKYSPEGGEIEVRVARAEGDAEASGSFAVLTVRDEGVGIPEEEVPHVFEWFRRGANISGQITGAGIGLANVRQIVEQHGGTVTVESVEGVGSTFTVRLPLAH